MIRILDDYILDDHLRYEAHRLMYTSADGEEYTFFGMVGAAVLCALLADTDEGDKRGVALETPQQRIDFFLRYEREVRPDNGGLFETEVKALVESYMEIDGNLNILLQICRNDRLYDLALGLVIDYMNYLVREKVQEQIYIKHPFTNPFAQWLFEAGYVETPRQRLLTVDWLDTEDVLDLYTELEKGPQEEPQPTFLFEGLSSEQVLTEYWNWLWTEMQKEANIYPDANVQLAQIKKATLENETNYDFLKPDIKDFPPYQLNLFRRWMNKWTDFIKQQIDPPVSTRKKDFRQELFLDDVMPVPPERNYVKVREYILERCRYDKEFEKFFKVHKMTDFCDQLSFLFGWFVDPNSLGKRMRSKAKK